MNLKKAIYVLAVIIVLIVAFAGGRASDQLGTTTTHTFFMTSYVVSHVNSTQYINKISTVFTNSTTVTRTVNSTADNTTITVTLTQSTGS